MCIPPGSVFYFYKCKINRRLNDWFTRLTSGALKFIIDLSRKARQRSAVRNIEIRFILMEKLEYRVHKWLYVFVMCSDPGEVSNILGRGQGERVSQKDLEFC